MDQLTWLFIGTLATAATVGVFLTRLDEIITSLVGVLLWVIWGYGATNVEIVTETGAIVQQQYPQLTFVAGGFGVMLLFTMLKGTAWALHPKELRQPDDEEIGSAIRSNSD